MDQKKSLNLFLGKCAIAASFIFWTGCSSSPAPQAAESETSESGAKPIHIAPREAVEAHGKKWMIATQGKYSTQAAVTVLKAGGNLIDAAVAASLAVSVERPQSTGLGGGGFLIYHEGKSGKNFVFDYRERAPSKAKKDMFLNAKGEVIPDLSATGALSVGVPGIIRGLEKVHQRFGRKEWKELFAPAIQLADEGFPIYPHLANAIKEDHDELIKFSESKKLFLHEDGTPKLLNEVLVQKNLAQSLRTLSEKPEDFYTGKIADEIARSVKSEKGILCKKDLEAYTAKERDAVHAYWRGYEIISMPPPSSGGIHVIQILKMLEKDQLHPVDYQTTAAINLQAQAMQQAFADRAQYLGDPDFVKVPVKQLLNDAYLKANRAKFKMSRARRENEVAAGVLPKPERTETTHFTLMNDRGDVVVSTQTVNGYFGSHMVAGNTGIVLNDEMDDFSVKAGSANMFGAIGTTEANSVAPGKTPLSSMSPTIVLREGKPVLALGAPGGTRIITAVAQTILNFLSFKRDLYTSVAAPRIHQQWSPDLLYVENQTFPKGTLQGLRDMGWNVKLIGSQSHVMAVAQDENGLVGVADPRDIGTSAGE
jgi:gamma-glutamyltranspeptidase/glutathione hydrolase